MKRFAVLAVVPLVLLAACGGDDESSDETSPAATSDTATSDGGGEGGSDPDSAWCVAARDIQDLSDAGDALDFTDPEAVQEQFTSFRDALEDAIDEAPDEIQEDVEASKAAFDEIIEALEAADWNFLDIDTALFEELGTRAEEAGDRIEAYNERVCGIEASDDDEEPTSSSVPGTATEGASGTLREQLVAQFVATGFTEEEANCLADNFDFSDSALTEGDTTAILELFETCGIDLDRIAELGGALSGG